MKTTPPCLPASQLGGITNPHAPGKYHAPYGVSYTYKPAQTSAVLKPQLHQHGHWLSSWHLLLSKAQGLMLVLNLPVYLCCCLFVLGQLLLSFSSSQDDTKKNQNHKTTTPECIVSANTNTRNVFSFLVLIFKSFAGSRRI